MDKDRAVRQSERLDMDRQINYTDPGGDFDPDSYWKKVTGRDEEENGGDRYWNSFSDHGFTNKNDPDFGPIPEEYRSNGMSRAAFACGVLSIIAIFFNASLIFGALGLVFAFLSRERKLSRQAKAAMTLSTAGIAAFAVAIALSIFTLVSTGIWDDMMEKVQQMDPNDPDAISNVQREVLEELQERLLDRYNGLGGASGNGAGGAQTGSTAGGQTGGTHTDGTADGQTGGIVGGMTIPETAGANAIGVSTPHRTMTEPIPL